MKTDLNKIYGDGSENTQIEQIILEFCRVIDFLYTHFTHLLTEHQKNISENRVPQVNEYVACLSLLKFFPSHEILLHSEMNFSNRLSNLFYLLDYLFHLIKVLHENETRSTKSPTNLDL